MRYANDAGRCRVPLRRNRVRALKREAQRLRAELERMAARKRAILARLAEIGRELNGGGCRVERGR